MQVKTLGFQPRLTCADLAEREWSRSWIENFLGPHIPHGSGKCWLTERVVAVEATRVFRVAVAIRAAMAKRVIFLDRYAEREALHEARRLEMAGKLDGPLERQPIASTQMEFLEVEWICGSIILRWSSGHKTIVPGRFLEAVRRLRRVTQARLIEAAHIVVEDWRADRTSAFRGYGISTRKSFLVEVSSVLLELQEIEAPTNDMGEPKRRHHARVVN